MEDGNAFCAMLQAAAAQAAKRVKSTTKSGKGTVSTNVADYKDKDLQAAFASATVTTSVPLELIAYRKTVLGAHHADHEKLGMTEEQLTQAHIFLHKTNLSLFTANQTSHAHCHHLSICKSIRRSPRNTLVWYNFFNKVPPSP